MLVIKIELWPFGNEAKKEDLGTIRITNNGTGTKLVGNYDYEILGIDRIVFLNDDGKVAKHQLRKIGKILGFIRSSGPIILLYDVLKDFMSWYDWKGRTSGR